MGQAIQFSINTQFSCIWPIDVNLSGAIILGQSGPGSNGNKLILRIPQSSNSWNLTIRLLSVMSRTRV